MSMTVVIGAATTVSFGGACVQSANWGFNPGRQDAFCLGDFNPNDNYVIYKPTQTLSLTIYAPGPTYGTIPSTSCEIAATLAASVSPATCDSSVGDITGPWQVTGYSYSKEDKSATATESWSFTKWIGADSFLDSTAQARAATPTYILRGITQGQSTDPGTTGVSFSSTFATSQTGSVSAGGIGKASEITHGIVSSVGGGMNSTTVLGNGSASIPYTPLYI